MDDGLSDADFLHPTASITQRQLTGWRTIGSSDVASIHGMRWTETPAYTRWRFANPEGKWVWLLGEASPWRLAVPYSGDRGSGGVIFLGSAADDWWLLRQRRLASRRPPAPAQDP